MAAVNGTDLERGLVRPGSGSRDARPVGGDSWAECAQVRRLENAGGKPVHEILATEGPPGVRDVEWYLMPLSGHYGKRSVDAVWQYGDGLKV